MLFYIINIHIHKIYIYILLTVFFLNYCYITTCDKYTACLSTVFKINLVFFCLDSCHLSNKLLYNNHIYVGNNIIKISIKT